MTILDLKKITFNEDEIEAFQNFFCTSFSSTDIYAIEISMEMLIDYIEVKLELEKNWFVNEFEKNSNCIGYLYR